MLRGILKDQTFKSSDEIEGAITRIWDNLTADDVGTVFQNWTESGYLRQHLPRQP
jgi:hypothetical protein